jgi:tRNA U34 5-carboxymethylaminomethyl modifying enzyme MnmG/GidA
VGKTYLNSEEKLIVLTMAAFISKLEEIIESWQKMHKPPKTPLKLIRTSKTYAEKTLDWLCGELSEEELIKLIGKDHNGNRIKVRELEKMEVVIKYTKEAEREKQKIREFEKITTMETNDFIDLSELALASCSVCEASGKDADTCRFRKVFYKYDIPPVNCEAGPGQCPFNERR